jgi:hypothetical protein
MKALKSDCYLIPFMCRELVLTVAGIVMVKGELAESVEQDSWTWTLDKGRLGVLLSKTSPGIGW